MGEKQRSQPFRSTLEAVIQFYRDLGFFRGGDFAETAKRLLGRFEVDHGEPFDSEKPWDDVYLLSYDEDNVWVGDPECDVASGNRVYEQVLAEWSQISKGVLAVEGIKEAWQADEGPLTVTFRLNGVIRAIQPQWDNDWLDLDILGVINQMIAASGKQFACASDVNFAIVFLIDGEGRKRLTEERKFPFLKIASPT